MQNNGERSKTEKFIDDAAITTKIKTKLTADHLISAFTIHVDTENCNVTLSGRVPNEEAAKRAIDIAENTVGVNKINNKLDIANE